MNAPSDTSRRPADPPWAAPDPPPGSGLAWLSRAPARAAPPDLEPPDLPPPVGMIGAGAVGAIGTGPTVGVFGAGAGSVAGVIGPGSAVGVIGGGSGPTVSGSDPMVGGVSPMVGGAGPVVGGAGPIVGGAGPIVGGAGPIVGGAGPIVGGAGPVVGGAGPVVGGVGPPGSAGELSAGPVMTWLPDGRWVSADTDVAEPEAAPAPVDPGAAARRRGLRRITLARAGARLAGWPRRVLVGLLLLAAAALALRPHPPAVPATPAPAATEVVVAARDLAAGTVLAAADLRTVAMPDAIVPAGVVRRPAGLVGRLAAGAIRRGETVTDARVVGPGLTAGFGPGESAVPVRLADPDSAALVRPGDRVDVLGIPVAPDGAPPAVGDAVDVATGVRVLAVLGSRDAADGVVLVVAATQQTARRLVGASARHRLTVSVRSP